MVPENITSSLAFPVMLTVHRLFNLGNDGQCQSPEKFNILVGSTLHIGSVFFSLVLNMKLVETLHSAHLKMALTKCQRDVFYNCKTVSVSTKLLKMWSPVVLHLIYFWCISSLKLKLKTLPNNKTKQNKTKQNKKQKQTKQNKTKQNKILNTFI